MIHPSTLALSHLPEQVGAAAGGVFFFAGGAVAGAHHAAFFAAAFAHAHAAQSGLGKAAVVSEKLKVRLRLPGIVVGAQAQILVQLVGLDQLAGIHLPCRIPNRLELAEGLHQFRAKHFRKQFGARLAVAVLAGERAAVADHQVGGLFHELAELGDAVFRLQIEIDARCGRSRGRSVRRASLCSRRPPSSCADRGGSRQVFPERRRSLPNLPSSAVRRGHARWRRGWTRELPTRAWPVACRCRGASGAESRRGRAPPSGRGPEIRLPARCRRRTPPAASRRLRAAARVLRS